MNKDNYKENESQVESELDKLNISDNDSSSVNINHKNCYKPEDNKLWCKECVPRCIIEGWTSGNNDIDEFIKDTIYNTKYSDDDDYYYPFFLEWVPFDRFKDVKQIGEGGFAKVYSATWIDGKAEYKRQNDESWKKEEPKPIKVALKKLNDSQNISANYLNEIKTLWIIYFNDTYRCMSAIPNQRPTADELYDILVIWWNASNGNYQNEEKFGDKVKEIKAIFDEANKEIPNISTSYEKIPDAIYTSRVFTFSNLPKPVNSSIITSYLEDEEDNKDCQDSKLFDLEVPSN
ncbi:kinase-like domain-containing protein [Rhizophagus irregularis DAOM 181602=DAOM 197198]|nr:kinase-like domain-containing protein [Rhizophagus irregularis DAOM 181602=DAOM 197198]